VVRADSPYEGYHTPFSTLSTELAGPENARHTEVMCERKRSWHESPDLIPSRQSLLKADDCLNRARNGITGIDETKSLPSSFSVIPDDDFVRRARNNRRIVVERHQCVGWTSMRRSSECAQCEQTSLKDQGTAAFETQLRSPHLNPRARGEARAN
jgi:hypothetical protein